METKTAEEHAVYSEVEPEAAYSEVDVEEGAPRPTVVDEIRATICQRSACRASKGRASPMRCCAA